MSSNGIKRRVFGRKRAKAKAISGTRQGNRLAMHVKLIGSVQTGLSIRQREWLLLDHALAETEQAHGQRVVQRVWRTHKRRVKKALHLRQQRFR